MRSERPEPSFSSPDQAERGSVLVIALVMLVLFSVVGATFITLASTEGNIATNQQVGTRALYVAESGIHAAYRELGASNFQRRTHEADWTPIAAGFLQENLFGESVTLDGPGDDGLADERDDGWYVWEWNPGDEGSGLTGSNLPESFRFAVRPLTSDPDEDEYAIDAIGTVGRSQRHLRVHAFTEPAFTFALFADGPLSEFTRGEDQTITGKIHANGDMYFRPSQGTTLSIDSPMVSATGRMIRTTDIFGRDVYSGSTVRIKDRDGNWVEMDIGIPGEAMDSENPDWTNDISSDGIDGALELWDGIVRDGNLGAVSVDPPPLETMEPGGYYDAAAALRLRAGDVQVDNAGNDLSTSVGDAVKEVTFWNPAIDQYVTVQEIDLEQLHDDGNWPDNGLIYSEVPIRLKNATELASDLSIVANHSVYTYGHFNRDNKRSAAIVSTGRIWHLSSAWSDDDSVTMGPTSGRQAANGTTVINAAMVDGQPPIGTANYADLDGDGNRDDPGAGNVWANADHLLEAWGGSRTLQKSGSIVHLQFADMADDLYNSTLQPDEIAWVRYGGYTPPTRDYGYDPALSGLTGQPPFAPFVSKIYLWQEIAP